MRNQKNRTPPHIKINCRMYHLFLTPPYLSFMAAPSSSQPITRWEAVSRFDHKFRVTFSAKALNWKRHPISQPNTGMHFPQSPSTGNCIPLQRQIPGRSFRNPTHPEIPSHSAHIRA